MRRIFLLVALVVMAVSQTNAQSVGEPAASPAVGYDLTWYTVDNGGGTSNNGGYTLNGTIGQPDVGALIDGVYTLTGGFWFSAVAEQRLYLPLVLKSG